MALKRTTSRLQQSPMTLTPTPEDELNSKMSQDWIKKISKDSKVEAACLPVEHFRINTHLLFYSMELRELELKLKSASVSKARAEQIAEREAMKLETKVHPFLLTVPSSPLSDYSVTS